MAKATPIEGIEPEGGLRINAALIIPVRVAELRAWEAAVQDPERIEELHAMRIAAKRLRYTMEIFASAYGKPFAAAITQVKAIQERLGTIHDADVLVPQLHAHLRQTLELPKEKKTKTKQKRTPVPEVGVHRADWDAAAGLLTLCRQRAAARDTTYEAFRRHWAELTETGFWERLDTLIREPDETPPSSPEEDSSPQAISSSEEDAAPKVRKSRRHKAPETPEPTESPSLIVSEEVPEEASVLKPNGRYAILSRLRS